MSHKLCWPSARASGAVETDGGFAFQMRALSELFDQTTVLVPVDMALRRESGNPVTGHNLTVVPLAHRPGRSPQARRMLIPIWLLKNLPRIVHAIREADVVHTPVPSMIGTYAMLLATVMRKPLIVRHCGDWNDLGTAWKRFHRRFMELRADAPHALMLATGAGDTPPSPGTDVRWIFSTALSESQLAALLPTTRARPALAPQIITVARQEAGKGTDVLIEAMPTLLRSHQDIRLHVVGDGTLRERNQALARDMGVLDRVVFHGSLPHNRVVGLLQEADIFCLPTSGEGFPKAVVEAMACGLPVVTSAVSVLPALVADAGCVVHENTAEKIASAIEWCLQDTERYARMSAAAHRIARQYSLEAWRDRIGQLLNERWALRNAAFS